MSQNLARQNEKKQAIQTVSEDLNRKIDYLEAVLPPFIKGQAQRLINRALLTMARDDRLAECPMIEFVQAVLSAAEIGLAIDGKNCYVVRYKDRYQAIPSYIGMTIVAKRTGRIKDVFADTIYSGDDYLAEFVNGQHRLTHRRNLAKPRGEWQGCYACLIQEDGSFRYLEMSAEEVNKRRDASPAYKSSKGPSGPWVTWPDEMRKKVPIRNILKGWLDDPLIDKLIDLEDYEYGEGRAAELEAPSEPRKPPVGRQTAAPKNGKPARTPEVIQPVLEPERDPEPVAEEAQPEPEASESIPSAEEVELENLNEDLWSSLERAETAREMDRVGEQLMKHKVALGTARFDALLKRLQNKNRLMKEKAGKV